MTDIYCVDGLKILGDCKTLMEFSFQCARKDYFVEIGFVRKIIFEFKK